MNTKVQKTILGKKVKSFQFYKMNVANLYKEKTFGFIWLEDNMRIRIEKGKFFFMNADGKKTGIILKGTEGYKKIKRMVAIWFKNYLKQGIRTYANSTIRESCQQVIYNLRINQIQNGRISFNHYYSA